MIHSLINCKIQLKLKWINYRVLSAVDEGNANNRDDHIIFTIKATKLYVSVVTFSARDNQKLSKLHSKKFKRSVYWNEYETKSENKNTTNEYRYFPKWNFVGVNRLFVYVYLNRSNDVKQFKSRRYYLPKGIIFNYNVIINGKNFYDHAIDSDIKLQGEIRNLKKGQGEDYTIGCYLHYDHMKNHYRLITVKSS